MAHDIRGFFCSSHETSDSKVTQPLGNEDDKTDVSHPVVLCCGSGWERRSHTFLNGPNTTSA